MKHRNLRCISVRVGTGCIGTGSILVPVLGTQPYLCACVCVCVCPLQNGIMGDKRLCVWWGVPVGLPYPFFIVTDISLSLHPLYVWHTLSLPPFSFFFPHFSPVSLSLISLSPCNLCVVWD